MEKGSFELFRSYRENPVYQNLDKPIVIGDALRTPENMGLVLRLSGNFNVLKTIFISEEAKGFREFKIRRTASGGEKTDWKIIEKVADLKAELPDGYKLVAIETTPDAENIFNFTFPEKAALIVGNEVLGISDELLKMADHKVYVPLPGPVSSLNVTHALSVALFEWLRQKITKFKSDK
jgi:tRNA G18 (ribose-2'-O)-methylase SpoU